MNSKVTMGQRDGEMVCKPIMISYERQLAGKGNFEEEGQLFLLRCYDCGGEHGKENYFSAVAKGVCAWCGWNRSK